MSLAEGPFVFRVNENGSGPNLLIQVCTERGWREYSENASIKDGWNLWWKTSAFSVSQHKHLKAWQFTNHIPKGASICRKDNLARNLKCMRKVYGSVYDISPRGYNLPLEYTKLVADCSRREEDDDESPKVWICKPVGQSQGRGIFLFKSLGDLCYDSNAVVQKYIKNPLLIGGYKFDLRLYVCVPSYHPLTIYLYKEGIVRFSTDKFSLADLNNPFCHLTNSSLNKLGPGYAEQKDRVGAGCKWSLKQLRQYFHQAGIRDWLLWQKISALVTLTILSQSTSVPQTTNCFEFYGFDVLVDEKLKPWLLEVNLSPALGYDCDIDPVVKKPLLHDLFDLLGLPVCNTGLSLFTIFAPCDESNNSNNTYSENEDGNDTDRKPTKHKVKQKTRGSNHRLENGINSSDSSALIVATAATKWRRKKRTTYLFGPPHKPSLEYNKLKSCKHINKSLLVSSTPTNVVELMPTKDHTKSEDKKDLKKISETDAESEIKDTRQKRKSANNGKRNRENNRGNKCKSCNSATEIIVNEKVLCTTPPKTMNSIIDGSKTVLKIENCIGDNKTKKKKNMEFSNPDHKHAKCRTVESKTSFVYDKPKKIYPSQTDNNLKTVMLPFDKSCSSGKGFKGRTKISHSASLWGNGRDWRNPMHREGDWSRIYPLSTFNTKFTPTFDDDCQGNKFSVGDKQIRLVVHHVTNFIKISKQLYYKDINATEEELNTHLINHLGLTGDVWLPSK